MRAWLETDHDVLFMAASGTGALEGAVANLLSPGEPALFGVMGWFGELWVRIAAAYGADVVRLDAGWGDAIEPAALADALDRHPEVRKVFLTHNETSTGVRNDIEALAADREGPRPAARGRRDQRRAGPSAGGRRAARRRRPRRLAEGLARPARPRDGGGEPGRAGRRGGGHDPALLLRLRAPAARPGARAHAHHRAAAGDVRAARGARDPARRGPRGGLGAPPPRHRRRPRGRRRARPRDAPRDRHPEPHGDGRHVPVRRARASWPTS